MTEPRVVAVEPTSTGNYRVWFDAPVRLWDAPLDKEHWGQTSTHRAPPHPDAKVYWYPATQGEGHPPIRDELEAYIWGLKLIEAHMEKERNRG